MMGFEILILAVIGLAVLQTLGRRSFGAGMHAPSTQSVKEVLDARLARGEINVDEYRKLRETLETQAVTLPTT